METNYVVISKKEIKKYRHKAERRWYRRLVVINIIIILFVVSMTLMSKDDHRKYFQGLQKDIEAFNAEISAELKEINTDSTPASSETIENSTTEKISSNNKAEDIKPKDDNPGDSNSDNATDDQAMDKIIDKIEDFPPDLKLFFMVILLLVFSPFLVSYLYAQYRSMSIKITEKNFPEIHEIAKEYTQRLGLKKTPAIYIIQGNGILNAFASFIPFKQYIELYADLVEVAYREHQDMDTLRFIIGHEMAHIYLRHATLHYYLTILFANIIPVIGSTASRAREYSCDRIAQKLSGSDGIEAMMILTAGIHLYKKVDIEDYLKYARSVRGFFVWLFNLLSTHPITTKRVLALEMKDGSGKLY